MQMKERDEKIKWLLPLLIGLFIATALLHIGSVLITNYSDLELLLYLAPWFDLDNERNFSASYNALLWAGSAITCFMFFGRTGKIDQLRWLLMGLLFGYIAADELFVVHERMAAPIRNYLEISKTSPLYHAWVVVAIGAVTAI